MGLCPCARARCPPPARGPGTPEMLRAPTPSSASGSGGICPGWQAQPSPSQVHSGRCRSLPPPPSWGHRLWLRGATGQGLPSLQPGTPRLTPALSEHPEPSQPPAAGYTQGGTPPHQGKDRAGPQIYPGVTSPPRHGGDTHPGGSGDRSSQQGPRHQGRAGVPGGHGTEVTPVTGHPTGCTPPVPGVLTFLLPVGGLCRRGGLMGAALQKEKGCPGVTRGPQQQTRIGERGDRLRFVGDPPQPPGSLPRPATPAPPSLAIPLADSLPARC